MTFKEIQELVKILGESEISEFNLKDGKFELAIKTKHFQDPELSKVALQNSSFVAAPQMPVVAPPVPVAASPQVASAASAPQVDLPSTQPEKAAPKNLLEIRSPIVGTFYRSSSPDKPPYAKIGDTVAVGDVVCIVEAMKLFNEIESEVAGKIVNVLIEDAQPVEYDQVLFEVDPNG